MTHADLGLARRALAEYVALGAPTDSLQSFLKWFTIYHQQKRDSRHAPAQLKAA